MTDSDTPNSEEGSKKTLIRVLIIVGIGIPVLVELLTLFNLVNVQLFNDETDQMQKKGQPVQTVEFAEGDTLFTDSNFPVVISAIQINVSAQEWVFELQLLPSDTTIQKTPLVKVDSLKLKNSNLLRSSQEWSASQSKSMRWPLPNGQIPIRLYMSARESITGDSARHIHQEVPLGNIPVRYTRRTQR